MAPKMCGVGVVLVQVSGGAVCVKSVNKGGPASNSQQINRGDVLYAIDGQKVGVCPLSLCNVRVLHESVPFLIFSVCVVQVLGWDVERVKPLILGPVGSQITMSFQRVGNQVAGKRSLDVQMIHQPVDP